MNEITALIATIKKMLKKQGITYRDLSQSLNLSEASVKRMFAAERLTLERLSQVSSILGFTLSELTQAAAADKSRISMLSMDQEGMLVADLKLLLTAVCVLNHWKLSEIVEVYAITEFECLQKLLILDRMGMIALLPENRIRLIVARDFEWLKDGPISRFFREHGQQEFLNHPLSEEDSMMFIHGMLTDAAFAELGPEIQKLKDKLADLHNQSLSVAVKNKTSASLLLGLRRNWEPTAFSHLRKT